MKNILMEIKDNNIKRITDILWKIYNNYDGNTAIDTHTINNSINFIKLLSTTLLEKITSNEIYSTPYGTIIIKFI